LAIAYLGYNGRWLQRPAIVTLATRHRTGHLGDVLSCSQSVGLLSSSEEGRHYEIGRWLRGWSRRRRAEPPPPPASIDPSRAVGPTDRRAVLCSGRAGERAPPVRLEASPARRPVADPSASASASASTRLPLKHWTPRPSANCGLIDRTNSLPPVSGHPPTSGYLPPVRLRVAVGVRVYG